MKRTLGLLLLLTLSAIGMCAQGLYVGVEGLKTFEKHQSNSNWEFGAYASYSHSLFMRLGFDVQAGLYTQYFNDGTTGSFMDFIPYPDWVPPKYDRYAVTFGGKLGAHLTLKVAGPISIFTGPSVRCNFFQKDYRRLEGEKYHAEDYDLRRAVMQWGLGLSGDFKRFRVRLSWEADITKACEDSDKAHQNGVMLSLAYRL